MQLIYYPVFTIAGITEPAGLLVLLFLAPSPTLAFWLPIGAFVALLVVHLPLLDVDPSGEQFLAAGIELKGLG